MGEVGPQSLAALSEADPWAPVSMDGLPVALVAAVESEDWVATKRELGPVLDSINTDGVYGRSLLQIARRLPIGLDPVFDRYRGAVAIDYGDWDDLRRCMDGAPVGLDELEAARQVFLRSVTASRGVPTTSPMQDPSLPNELLLSGRLGLYRQWAKRLPSADGTERWARQDVPLGRHFRMRQLHHAALRAAAEAQGGSLEVASALGREAAHLGDPGEPLRDIAEDVVSVASVALGEAEPNLALRFIARTPMPSGLSPLGTFEWLHHLAPFLTLYPGGLLEVSAQLMHRIATRLGSPRAQLIAEAWVVGAQAIRGSGARRSDLRALLAGSRSAGPGLRVLPELLSALASERYSSFQDAERLARKSGVVWAQVTSLVWMTALDPDPRTSRYLSRLLELTGWRRPIFVDAGVMAEAVMGLFAHGVRSRPLLELALGTGRSTIATEVAVSHATDKTISTETQGAAVEALAKLGTSHSRRMIEQIARAPGPMAELARGLLTARTKRAGLSDREIEVIELVGQGMTNRAIADTLDLSPHTVARHISNARDKLGASNRADAAVRLGRMAPDLAKDRQPSTRMRVRSPRAVSRPYRTVARG